MSDDEIDVGMTQAMDMIAKLNEEHSETIEKNIKLEKEIQDMKDKAAKIFPGTCTLCRKEKKSQWKTYNPYENNHNPSKGDGSDDFESDIKDIDEFNTDCRIVSATVCSDCWPFAEKERIDMTRSDMIKWGQKFSKNHKLTDHMVREHARIKREIVGSDEGDVYGDYPCYFANLNNSEEDIGWAMYHYAIA